jgi:hypothetical protein
MSCFLHILNIEPTIRIGQYLHCSGYRIIRFAKKIILDYGISNSLKTFFIHKFKNNSDLPNTKQSALLITI